MKKKYSSLKEFTCKNKVFMSEPIVKNFIENSLEHKMLLKRAIENNDEEASEMLDCKFVEFFYKYRIISYIATLSHNLSIEFDKKQRKRTERIKLLLDQPTNNLMNIIQNKNDLVENNSHLTGYFTNENLINALKKLTSRQMKIIELIYVYGYKQKQIAKMLNVTPQYISRTKKISLDKLRGILGRGEYVDL